MTKWDTLHEAIEALEKCAAEEQRFPERLAGAFSGICGVRVMLNDYIPANVVMIGTGRKTLERWGEGFTREVAP